MSVLQATGDTFTHAGIVVTVGTNDVHVAHACPVKPAIVRVDRLSELLAQDEITSVAVYRPRVRPAEAVRAATIAEEYVSRKTPFDFELELADDHAVYCTELIWLSYRAAGFKIKTSRKLLFPSDLLNANFFQPLVSDGAQRAQR